MTDIALMGIDLVSPEQLRLREASVLSSLRGMERVAVAFSGGVDSGLVLSLAVEAVGTRATALTAVSESLARRELDACRAFAAGIGVRHELIRTVEVADPRYAENTEARCYWCKEIVYTALGAYAAANQRGALVDGMNTDDTREHRPGRAAAEALGVVSPLFEAGLSKADVRALALSRGLSLWDKPAMACLSSRIAYGESVTQAKLAQVEAAEEAIGALGFGRVRVRVHGHDARVEVDPVDVDRLVAHRPSVDAALVSLGFERVTIDMNGYRPASGRPE